MNSFQSVRARAISEVAHTLREKPVLWLVLAVSPITDLFKDITEVVPLDCRAGPLVPVDATWPLAQWLQHLQNPPPGDERVLKAEVELRGDQFPVPKVVAQIDWAQLFANSGVEFPQVLIGLICFRRASVVFLPSLPLLSSDPILI